MYKKTLIHKLCRSIIRSSPNEKIIKADERSKDDDYVSDDIIVSEPEIKTLDFAPRPELQPEKQPDSESEPMANREQAAKIIELAKQAGTKDEIFDHLTAWAGRPIEKIRELSQIEAARYIGMIEAQIDLEKNDGDDEAPPWK